MRRRSSPWLIKFLTEDSATDRFDACHYQIETLLDKIDEAEEEQDELDRELPLTRRLGRDAACNTPSGTWPSWNGMLPVESQRREVAQEIDVGRTPPQSWPKRNTRRRSPIGRPGCARWACRTTSRPTNLATMAGQCERLAELEARIENRRDDMQRRQREFAIVSQRIFTLAEETRPAPRESHAARAARSSASRVSTSTCSVSSSGRRSASGRKRCGPKS